VNWQKSNVALGRDMRWVGSFFLVCVALFIGGCGRKTEEFVDHGLEPQVAAERAREALLTLMREKPTLFEGTDADELESFPIEPSGPNEFTCGAFVLNTQIMSYSSAIPVRDGTQLIEGKFRLETDGRWIADDPKVQNVSQ
jgi:hypothetical protein